MTKKLIIVFSFLGFLLYGEFTYLIPFNSFTSSNVEKFIPELSLDLVIENLFDLGIAQLYPLGFYGEVDREVYSFLGASYSWLEIKDRGFCVNDLFFAGSSLYKIDFHNNNIDLNFLNNSLNVETDSSEDNEIAFAFSQGTFINDSLEFGANIQRKLWPVAPHPLDRNPPVSSLRRRTKFHQDFRGIYNFQTPTGIMKLRNRSYFGKRSFLSFAHDGFASNVFWENYSRIILAGEWNRSKSNSSELIRSVAIRYGHLFRDKLYSEDYYSINETAILKQDSASVWFDMGKNNLNVISGINYSHKSIVHSTPNFSRNIIDQDGEGFEPWYPDMTINEIGQNNNLAAIFNIDFLDSSSFQAELKNGLVIITPKNESSYHPVYYYTNNHTNAGLFVSRYKSSTFGFYLGSLKTVVNFNKKIFQNSLHFDGSIGLSLNTMLLKPRSGESLILPAIPWSFHTLLCSNKIVHSSLNFGSKDIPLTSQVALLLADEYLSGTSYFWNDSNQNRILNSGEESEIPFTDLGGKTISPSTKLKTPHTFYFDFPTSVKIGKYFGLNFRINYQSFVNLFTIRHRESIEKYGNFIDGKFIYTNSQVEYLLENLDKPLLGKNVLVQNPFYAGALLKIVGQGKRWYFSFAFNAYMVVGISGLGNGYAHNSVGSLSTTLANPNSALKNIGRKDSDRSYLGKIIIAVEPLKDLWLTTFLKYKDGQSFSHFQSSIYSDGLNNQAIIWNETTKGDNIYNKDFGTREDAQWNLDAVISYKIKMKSSSFFVYFKVINIIDLGLELSERTFSNGRSALESENPRAYAFGMKLNF